LNCVHGPTTTPCGKCDNCKEIAAGNSLDVIELDAASNRGIDDVRELRDNVRYAPAKSRLKIYIVDEVHMLTKDAANALLKTLEEPPKHVIFCLATTEPEKLPITILSRCQRFDLHRIPANLIARHLQSIATQEKVNLEPAAAHAIARGADGGMRDAESMLDQLVSFCGEEISEDDVLNVFGFTSEQVVADFTEQILRGATSNALELLNQQAERGKNMMQLLTDLISYLRDLLVCKVKPEAMANEDEPQLQEKLQAQAGLIETDRLLELIEQFAEAENRMKWAPNKKLHFEVATIKAIQTLSQVTLDEVIENLSALRDGKPTLTRAQKIVAGVADPGAETTNDTTRPNDPGCTASLDVANLWRQLLARIPAQKKFLKTLIESTQALGTEGRNFLIGYSPEQRSTIDTLGNPKNRAFLETLLKEISNRDWIVKFSEQKELSGEPRTIEDPTSLSSKKMTAESFKDDPLIREALEIFKGEIKP